MDLILQSNPQRGYAFLQSGGDIDELARALNAGMVRHVPAPMDVPKVKGAVKAFSFHWSNAQAKWDVVAWKDFPWHLDGAEFILFIGKDALSPVDQLWSLAEMRYVAKKLAQHPGFGFAVRAHRLAQRWLEAAAGASWSGPAVFAAAGTITVVLRGAVPGITWKYTSKGLPSYGNTTDPSGYIRFELPDSHNAWMGVFAAPEIAFQAGWDTARKKFVVTSFKEELAFPTPERMLAFLSDASKVTAFLRKGLKTLDPGLAAFYSGKVTPDGVVNRVLEVKANFATVDEWHSTTLNILLMLRTAKPVPHKLVETWLRNHWADVQKLAPTKTPKPAGQPSRWASYDDDDYDGYDSRERDYDSEDDDWKMDRPAPGLDWIVPSQMTFQQIEGFQFQQDGNRMTVSVNAAIR